MLIGVWTGERQTQHTHSFPRYMFFSTECHMQNAPQPLFKTSWFRFGRGHGHANRIQILTRCEAFELHQSGHQIRKHAASSGHFSDRDWVTAWTTCWSCSLMIRPATPTWVLSLTDSSFLFNTKALQRLWKSVVKERVSSEDNVATETSADTRIWPFTSWSRPWRWVSTEFSKARSGCAMHLWACFSCFRSCVASSAEARCLTSWAQAHNRLVTSNSLHVPSPSPTTWMRVANKSGRNTWRTGQRLLSWHKLQNWVVYCGRPRARHFNWGWGAIPPKKNTQHLQFCTGPGNDCGTPCWHCTVMIFQLLPSSFLNGI